jgi:hypothetical protein
MDLNRRQAIVGLGGAILPATLIEKETSSKFLLIVYLGVGNMSSRKAEEFADRTREKLVAKQDNNFRYLIIPQREFLTYAEVCELSGEQINQRDAAWFKDALDRDSLTKLKTTVLKVGETEEEVREYMACMFGSPIKELPVEIEEKIENAIDLGKRYNVKFLKNFVAEILEEELNNQE